MRKFKVKVNNKDYEVEIEELGQSSVANQPAPVKQNEPKVVPVNNNMGGTQIKSPMPGLVLSLTVPDGSTVKKNDKILVLEAMKMENDIVAACDGVISYTVKKGDNIETNAVIALIK